MWFLNLTRRRGSGWSQAQVRGECDSEKNPPQKINLQCLYETNSATCTHWGPAFLKGIFSAFLIYLTPITYTLWRDSECTLACKGRFLSWTPPFLPLLHQNPALIPLVWPSNFLQGWWRTHSRSFSELHFFCGEENVLPPVTRSLCPPTSCSGYSSFPPGLGSTQQSWGTLGWRGLSDSALGDFCLPFSTVKHSSFPSLP